MNFGRRTLPWLTAATILVAGCAASSVDVTNSAGEPITESPSMQGQSGEIGAQETAPGCPAELGSTSGAGLPCLGLGPQIDVFELPGVTVVPVWASWCEPCRAELPILQELYESGTRVVGVAAADNSGAASDLTQELNLTFPTVQDPDSTTRASFGWSGLPATFVVIDGEIVSRISGQVTSVAQLRQAITSGR